ncbi:MAG: hypothetical protein ACYTG0_44160 [Planctomycetota bacterium]|jgi:hypothetical protein
MATDRRQKLVKWMKKRKVATMKALRHQFQLSHMTVFRILKQYGYYTSYNYNASYYALHDVPEFDEAGLWTYRDIRFSHYGTLNETIVVLVQEATAGMTLQEVEDRLQTKAANLLCRLVHDGRLRQLRFRGRQLVYLAADPKQADRQYQQRQQPLQRPTAAHGELPEGCSPSEVIEILRQMVLSPQARPDQLARQLTGQGVDVTARQVRRVIDHYALGKKRHR